METLREFKEWAVKKFIEALGDAPIFWSIISLILIGLCGLVVLLLSAPLILTIIAELIWG